MSFRPIWIFAVAAALLLSLDLQAQNPGNPIEDALLRWYPANQATLIPMQGTCTSPQGLAFDGAHMWVACANDIEEYNTSDGSFAQRVGVAHSGYLLYDGANIWATNPTAGTITDIQASTGTVLGPVTVGTNPTGMAFDGRYIWVTNKGNNPGNLSRVDVLHRTSTPIALQSCDQPISIAFVSSDSGNLANGLSSSLWVVCNAQPEEVQELNSSGGFVGMVQQVDIGGSPDCNNIAFDGRQYIWVPTAIGPAGKEVLGIDTTNLSVTHIALPSLTSPIAVAFDGTYIWVADGGSPNVAKMLPSAGALVTYYPTGAGYASFDAFDGGNMWVSTPTPNGVGYTVSKM